MEAGVNLYLPNSKAPGPCLSFYLMWPLFIRLFPIFSVILGVKLIPKAQQALATVSQPASEQMTMSFLRCFHINQCAIPFFNTLSTQWPSISFTWKIHDRKTQWAAVYRVTKSLTPDWWLTFTFHSLLEEGSLGLQCCTWRIPGWGATSGLQIIRVTQGLNTTEAT